MGTSFVACLALPIEIRTNQTSELKYNARHDFY